MVQYLKYLYGWKENKRIFLNKIKSNIKMKPATIFYSNRYFIVNLILPQKVFFLFCFFENWNK